MDRDDRRLVGWWVALVALTIGALEVSLQLGDSAYFVVGLILFACIKIRIVILHFMEVSTAPLPLRLPLEAWSILIGVAILGLWFSAR